MLAGEEGLRLSLAGAQDKLPVVFRDGRIGQPLNGAPSTHILKTPIHSLAESVMNEGFCLALAEAAQLEPARGFIHSVKGSRFLLLERYDRVDGAAGRVQRLHQEDFCQALGMPTEMKYQNEGGPGLAQCFGLVRRMTRPSAPQVLRLLDYVIFNVLIGNNDAHAKNFSLLHRGKVPLLAPLYDTLSTAVYPNLMSKMAMKIGSKYTFSDVQARHWHQFAENTGLSPAQTRKRVRELANLLPGVARTPQSEPGNGFTGNGLVKQIVKVLEQRATLTIERL
jgi:serine/threonine-protein kinase HipA